MTQTIYSQEIQVLIDELSKITDLTPEQIASLSTISKHCLALSIFERKRTESQQVLTSLNSKVSFAELVQDRLSQGYEELAKLIDKIDPTQLKTSASMTQAQAQADLDKIKKNVELVIQGKKDIIENLNDLADAEVNSPTALKLDPHYDSEEKFKIALRTYAKSMRSLTNKLDIACPIYSPKTPLGSSKDKTVEDVTKEMTDAFFKELRDLGYNVEDCAITISEKKHTFTETVSSSDQSKYTSEAKANASKLLTGSYISQESYFDETMTKEDWAKLKNILQQQRAAEAKAKAAVEVRGPLDGGASLEGVDKGADVTTITGADGVADNDADGASFKGGGYP